MSQKMIISGGLIFPEKKPEDIIEKPEDVRNKETVVAKPVYEDIGEEEELECWIRFGVFLSCRREGCSCVRGGGRTLRMRI